MLTRRLLENDAARTRDGMLFILGGVAVSLTMALLIALVIHNLLSLVFGGSVLTFYGWSALLVLGIAAIVVLRVRAPHYDGPINGLAVGPEMQQMRTAIRHYTPGLRAEPIVDIEVIDQVLVGPRMLIVGIRLQLGTDAQHRQRFFERCALLLRTLASAGESVSFTYLMADKHEPIAVVEQVITYLEFQDWIGANSTRQKIWLSSQAKTTLPVLGIPNQSPKEI